MESFQEKYARNLTLIINEKKFNSEILVQIHKIIDENPGNCNLFFNVINNGSSKVFRSKEYKVKPTVELISNLKKILGEDNLNVN